MILGQRSFSYHHHVEAEQYLDTGAGKSGMIQERISTKQQQDRVHIEAEWMNDYAALLFLVVGR